MTICARCASDTAVSADEGHLCPTCLLRLGLDDATVLDSDYAFRVIAPIGRGPHGTVYLAEAPGPTPFLTVKRFDDVVDAAAFVTHVRDLVQRLRTCAAASSVTILDAGCADDSRVFVLARYVPGTAIDTYFQTGRLASLKTLPFVAGLCRIVADLHDAAIVHGALKATNVIAVTGEDGSEPVLLDTGLCGALESARPAASTWAIAPSLRRLRPDVRGDLSALRRLVADLLTRDSALEDARDVIRAFAAREFESAVHLGNEAVAIASRTIT